MSASQMEALGVTFANLQTEQVKKLKRQVALQRQEIEGLRMQVEDSRSSQLYWREHAHTLSRVINWQRRWCTRIEFAVLGRALNLLRNARSAIHELRWTGDHTPAIMRADLAMFEVEECLGCMLNILNEYNEFIEQRDDDKLEKD